MTLESPTLVTSVSTQPPRGQDDHIEATLQTQYEATVPPDQLSSQRDPKKEEKGRLKPTKDSTEDFKAEKDISLERRALHLDSSLKGK